MNSPKDIAQQLAQLAYALTAEKEHDRLLDQIVAGSMRLTNADGGTLYTVDERSPEVLCFKVMHNRSLQLREKPAHMPPVILHEATGDQAKLVVAETFKQQVTINIPDAYSCSEYDFSGIRTFDETLGYRSRAFLSVPLRDHEGEMIGVLQLINALDEQGTIVPFSAAQQALIESVASLAATALTKQRLIEAQRNLFESFIQLIGRAIDHKSPVTGKHCEQVPEIAMLLAQAICQAKQGPYASVSFTDEELYELRIAAWLHDCGKIATPEAIIDKATKLHTLVDRIELVEGRFRELKQQRRIELLERLPVLSAAEADRARAEHDALVVGLDEDLAFLRQANIGGEFMTDEDQQRVLAIAQLEWRDINGAPRRMLSEDEVQNLCIRRGTLTDAERQIMRDHIKVTIEMLESLRYPRPLRNVPEIAGNHHECLNGNGYPRGLKAAELSLRARIMCIADIFEALTSPDRPYKKGMRLSQACTIMGRMVEDGHLDRDLFALFLQSGAYLEYARRHMSERQIDAVDIAALPGLC